MAVSVTRIAPPNTPTGVTATASYGFEKCYNTESGTLVDRTSEFQNAATPVNSFVAQNDYIYLGVHPQSTLVNSISGATNDSRFIKIYLELDTVASSSVVPTFEYNTGNNTWVAFSNAPTDGTNGFTQSGTITFAVTGFPIYTVWIKGSQNGSGVEIGDSVDRVYVRIKRTAASLTTPPKIKQCGTGMLTANKTYYYRMVNVAALDVAYISTSMGARLSVPCAEVSATTTDYKRTVLLNWNTDSLVKMVWRTPTSGNYLNSANYSNQVGQIDNETQNVKPKYFGYGCASTASENYVYDDGMPPTFNYAADSSIANQNLWGFYEFKDYGRGLILVSGGTSGTPATFNSIYNADIAGGWNTFIKQSLSVGSVQLVRQFLNHDNIYIKDYFTDYGVCINTDATIVTNDATSVILGQNVLYYPSTGGTKYVYKNGFTLILTASMCQQWVCSFKNTKFYHAQFISNSLSTSLRTYIALYFYDNCELHDVWLDADSGFENFTISGPNIIYDNVYLGGLRYGLSPSASAVPTFVCNNLTIYNCVALAIPEDVANNSVITLESPVFKGLVSNFGSTYFYTYAHSLNTVSIILANPTFDTSTSTLLSSFRAGDNWTTYEQYDLSLYIIDKTGVGISGATVTIKDATGIVVQTSTSDSNGLVTSRLTKQKYTADISKYVPGYAGYYLRYINQLTSLTPHVVTISRVGYQTKILKLDINQKMSEVVALERQVPIIILDGDKTAINLVPTDSQNVVFGKGE